MTQSDAHGALVDQLDEHVRALVRREGVDPQRDAVVVRRIAESVVREHDERSLTGQVAPVADVGAVVGELVARVSGFGPLQPFLDDPAVEEVWVNDPSRVFVARHGRHELTNLMLTRAQVDELVERMLKSSGRRIDISQPFVDAMLPEGHRLHVVLEGISRGFSAVNIRKFVLRAARLSDLVELGSMTPRAAAFLEASVRAGLNILVAGGTQAGKTTMLNCLAAAIPGGDRVVSAEEVFELRNMSRIQTCDQLSISHKVSLSRRSSSPCRRSPPTSSTRYARTSPRTACSYRSRSISTGASSTATTGLRSRPSWASSAHVPRSTSRTTPRQWIWH
ncbi:Flp pilus assembly complex ATPase component TadA [Nocardioides sp. cx-173]|uniref:ATPase, T2SS/T4P/T4SS family n=1 Tax=Nocardioides sp. cx-173 TaxID=2898796 RepID=UPI001E465249|nr:ATPase, T2SS/T4P/T4SS family [Nocardioides sp. cx-173]MCD4525226.1 Flp pilus assembly complex ATPase component TadA [Nocardioides sp. cx-173]UGB40971.1 Flp pilus assembly complex ATPase component TadA [Nocardioides sp. cx-173]